MLRLNSGQVIVNRGSTWRHKALRLIHVSAYYTFRRFLPLSHPLFKRLEFFNVICHVKFPYLMLMGALRKIKSSVNLVLTKYHKASTKRSAFAQDRVWNISFKLSLPNCSPRLIQSHSLLQLSSSVLSKRLCESNT